MARAAGPSRSQAAPVSAGNRVAQFIFLTAMFCALYQLFDGHDESSVAPFSTSSPAGNANGKTSDALVPAPATYRREDTRHLTASECTCFLACLGLFGLLHHNKKRSRLEDSTAVKEEEEQELQRALMLSRKAVARSRANASSSERPDKQQLSTCSAVQAASTSIGMSAARSLMKTSVGLEALPEDIANQVLLFLTPKELATSCALVARSWEALAGDEADQLWQLVFERDFGERGDRFSAVFPINSWRQFYFRHRISRAVELARLLDMTENRKCVAIEGLVYDITAFIDSHPGGAHVIGDAVGTDATDLWEQFQHSSEAKDMMKEFLVYDEVLADPSEHLHGNLEHVVTQWRRFSWCLTHSHCFGSMSGTFASVMFRFHSRSRRRKQQHQ